MDRIRAWSMVLSRKSLRGRPSGESVQTSPFSVAQCVGEPGALGEEVEPPQAGHPGLQGLLGSRGHSETPALCTAPGRAMASNSALLAIARLRTDLKGRPSIRRPSGRVFQEVECRLGLILQPFGTREPLEGTPEVGKLLAKPAEPRLSKPRRGPVHCRSVPRAGSPRAKPSGRPGPIPKDRPGPLAGSVGVRFIALARVAAAVRRGPLTGQGPPQAASRPGRRSPGPTPSRLPRPVPAGHSR